ncbi:hypothetical protein KC340_g17764 [Hortaea werneckii]|nr:hypothetical protein KC342_g18013 [Hortaea werneckii]KAI7094114.1 hypothetical protein KC339_g11777 [Hortaea werneckii]KAI7206211.1 hypothetical protein KC365_g17312 [Hortaea werneckii]KAI7289169.1 hypothetical protein KC340_g17764 [Hortaea werneckii]KAI7373548.1 hypothetical protein KC328_g16569 [Hortaea werneckii]
MVHACATCASTFDHPFDPASEKPLLVGRDLPCCGRSICSRCLNQNKRYETYCPYCQITTDPSSLLPQGLRDPPAYDTAANEKNLPESAEPNQHDPDDVLPAYSEHHTNPSPFPSEKHPPNHDPPAQDVLHFVTPNDSIRSLSLAYGIPIPALRKSNNIYSDHLLQARRTVLIPGEFYKGGVSLSPRPVEGEEEEIRKGKVRRWMMGCKVAEYDVALLYLEQAAWDVQMAIKAYRDDEEWEAAHPLEADENAKKNKGKNAKSVGMRRFVGSSGPSRASQG